MPLPTKQQLFEGAIDGGGVMTIIGASYLLYKDLTTWPACDPGTVVTGPDADGIYDLLKCTPYHFNISDYDDGDGVNSIDDLMIPDDDSPEHCEAKRSMRPCELGAILICEGAFDSEFMLTKVCSVMWALAQMYLAIPIMLGGINTFNLLGLFNSFCVSAIPLLVKPLSGILMTLNGQGCEPNAECVTFPTSGDLVSLSLAWKTGQLAMAVNMKETSTKKLNSLALSIGAIGGAFAQSFFLSSIVSALSEAGGIDAATMFAANMTGIDTNSSNYTSSATVSLPGGISVASDPAQLVNYIKVTITGACAAAALAFAVALRNMMVILASAAFGSLMFAGAISGVIGGGMISLSGFMNGTFGACNARGMYVQMLMSGLFITVVRLHQKKRIEPGSKPYKLVEKAFKPAFEYNVKLELISQGKELPKTVVKKGPDGLPVDRIARIKYKAQKKMDDTKARAKKKVDEVKKKAKAKVTETKTKAIAMAKTQATKVKGMILKKKAGAAEAKGEDGGGDPETGDAEKKDEAKEEESGDAGVEESKGEGREDGAAEGGAETKPKKLKPGDEGYVPQKGWQLMIPGAAVSEICGKKRKHDSWVPPAPPVPEELEKLSPDDLAALLPAEGVPELIKVLLDRKVDGTILWNAIFAAVPPDLQLDDEVIADLLANKEMLLRCLERVGRAKIYAGFNSWRTMVLMEKMMAAMGDDDDDDDDDD